MLAYLFEVLPKIEKKFENGVLLLIPCIYIFLILISTILKLHITLLPQYMEIYFTLFCEDYLNQGKSLYKIMRT